MIHLGVESLPNVNDSIDSSIQKIALVLLVLFCLRALTVLLSRVLLVYSSLPISKNRPIKGFVQVLVIILYSLALILIFSIILNKSPLVFLSGLGAMTAILLLVFKDTILSLVAGIQITSNDFIRVGDWLEMPQFGADGDVIDISLHAIRVQNWDNTITNIPTHKFLENSFKNWRGMQESGGRRIKRSLFIDTNSIRFLTPDDINSYRRFNLLKEYLDQKEQELLEANKKDNLSNVNQRKLTNIGTFRAYVLNYLKTHPKIHKGMTLMVRQLEPGPDGLPLEIYVFTNTTAWGEYEGIQSDIFDHILAIATEFNIQIFQKPSGMDLNSGLKNIKS